MRNVVLSFIFTITVLVKQSDCFSVLSLFPVPIKSHFILHEKLLKELVRKGHDVHVVSHFPQKNPIPRYVDISIEGSVPNLFNISMEEATNKDILDLTMDMYKYLGRDLCGEILKHPAIIDLKNSTRKYDLILTEMHGTDCLLGFTHIFKAPVIGVATGGYLPWVLERMGNPDNPSYIPNYFFPRSGKMILFYKLQLAVATILTKLGYHALSTIPSEMRVRDFFGDEITPLDVLAFNTSLILVNAHFSLNEPKPTVPGIVEIGGLHIGPLLPLPTNLKKLLSNAKGFIYFSLGSVLHMNTIDEEKMDVIMNTLGKLPQEVLLKGHRESFPENLPKNIHVQDWFPQLELLCHSNIKFFITHGGLMSMQEAAHCGVPVLGIPVFPDHTLTVSNYISKGAGLDLTYSEISSQQLEEAFQQLLTNKSYSTAAKKLSNLFRDRPMKPLDSALYWIEYVVRHGGAPQLRTLAADLIWFEYYLLDVGLVIAAMFALAVLMMAFILDRLQNYFDAPYQTPPPESLKKQKRN